MKILIGTPTSDGMVNAQYMLSVRALEERLRVKRISVSIMFGSASFMPFSRNALASIVLEDKTYSHLLFIDSDISFKPEAVIKMLDAEKDIIGCFYPKRSINYLKLHHISQQISDASEAQSVTLDYAAAEMLQKAAIESDGKKHFVHATENGLIRTLRLGMGLTLIKRQTLERLAAEFPELIVEARTTHYSAMGLTGRVLQCFSSVSVNKLSLSEDLSFCQRWTDRCNGEIWACTDQTISHIGPATFTGRIADRLRFEDRLLREALNEQAG